ncbi:MAG: hypothetical protein EHM42_14690 [Planctomycetaceae bacterium]|nr:MAG: hypothetical protein EHM42_14690 [Planctomycetaceae bacterium]
MTTRWALTPFSAVLRVYNSLGTLIASAGLLRARNSVQLALIGAAQTARWFHARKEEMVTENRLERAAGLGLDDAVLRETQFVVAGYVRDAGLDPQLAQSGGIDQLRGEAVRVEDQFLGDAGRRIDEIISELATRHSGRLSRWVYELLLCALLAYVIGWPAFNFFYAHPWLGRPLVPSDFYIHGLVFLVIWSAILVMVFTSRLRGGLVERVSELARQMAQQRLARGLFPRLEQACRDLRSQHDQLEALCAQTAALRREIPVPTGLGAARSTMAEAEVAAA